MGFITDIFKDLWKDQCKPYSERTLFQPKTFKERDVDELMNNDRAEENTLLFEDAYNNDYDTEEIKKIKQDLYDSGCKDLSRAYEIAKRKQQIKEENLKKYYNNK